MNAYKNRCAITGCQVAEVLEAAHIIPYGDDGANMISNGLMLRSDIHLLFDAGLIAIDPDNYSVIISATLLDTSYGEFNQKKIYLPKDKALWPSREALRRRKAWQDKQPA